MAVRKKINPRTDCPNYSELINYCGILKGVCTATSPYDCEFSGMNKPAHKEPVKKSPEVEKPKVKSDLPVRPLHYTIEEQLRELGVEPTPIIKTLDKIGLDAELGSVSLDKYDGPPIVRPEPISDYALYIEWSENHTSCGSCGGFKFWRNIKLGVTDWTCDRCHPSLITPPVRTIFVSMKKPEPQINLDDF